MFRAAASRLLRASLHRPIRIPVSQRINLPVRPSQFVPCFQYQANRLYSAPTGLSRDEVEGRIVNLLKNFSKVSDPSKINGTSHFANDLGLDSLDVVEAVMAVEEEFSIEIPDKEADAIHSVDAAVSYILSQPDAH